MTMTNRKANKLDTWLPKRKYIKLLSLRKTCPLTFNERLVFSLLVYVSRQKKQTALSQRAIAGRLQLDKDTVPKLVASLIGHGLAEREAGLVHAQEPTGDRVNWFVYLSRPGSPGGRTSMAIFFSSSPPLFRTGRVASGSSSLPTRSPFTASW